MSLASLLLGQDILFGLFLPAADFFIYMLIYFRYTSRLQQSTQHITEQKRIRDQEKGVYLMRNFFFET
jgi:hypothetical protein